MIGFAGAPWTVATYMAEGGTSKDFAKVKAWMWSAPDEFQSLIDLLVDATIDYLVAQVDAGAEAIQLFESWAGILPEPEFRRWCIAPAAKIAAALREKCPSVPMIGFPRAAGLLLDAYAAKTGFEAVGLDSMVPLQHARQMQKRCAVQGNLDPLLLLAGGAAMTARVGEICAALGEGPFVFNLGHGILPQTPITHVEAMVAQVRAGGP